MEQEAMIPGRQVDLDENRSVWVGIHQDSFFFVFTREDGHKTKLRLSPEAAFAMVGLIQDASRKKISVSVWETDEA